MKREEVEKHLEKKVMITLNDNIMLFGTLYKTGTERFKGNPNLYIPKNMYIALPNNLIFRSSHIKKIDELETSKSNVFYGEGSV